MNNNSVLVEEDVDLRHAIDEIVYKDLNSPLSSINSDNSGAAGLLNSICSCDLCNLKDCRYRSTD